MKTAYATQGGLADVLVGAAAERPPPGFRTPPRRRSPRWRPSDEVSGAPGAHAARAGGRPLRAGARAAPPELPGVCAWRQLNAANPRGIVRGRRPVAGALCVRGGSAGA